MILYPAIVSTYVDSTNALASTEDRIRVRIPKFHGVANDVTGSFSDIKYCEDKDLPLAFVQRGLSDKEFSTASLCEGDIVYVMLENDDITTPIITGYASRFSFTTDPAVAAANKSGSYAYGYGAVGNIGSFEDFAGANNIVQMARSQVNKHDDGNNKVIYNDWYSYPETNRYGSKYPWCCVFACWVFFNTKINGESCETYFNGGKKTASCDTLMNYYKDRGQFISSGFKAGDLIFFNWDEHKNYNDAQHVAICVEDQVGTTGPVTTVGGNEGKWSGGKRVDNYNYVLESTYTNLNSIIGGARVTLPKEDSAITGTVEQQVFKHLTTVLNFGTAESPKYFNTAIACGILGNIERESSFRTTCIGDNGTSFGLCQWHNTRYNLDRGKAYNLLEFCSKYGYDYRSVTGQMYFLQYELQNFYKSSVLDKLLKQPNTIEGARNAARIWCINFEVPANKYVTAEKRANAAAEKYWPKYG